MKRIKGEQFWEKVFKAWYTGDDLHGDKYIANISYTKPTYPIGRCFVANPFQIKPKNIETMVVLIPAIYSGFVAEFKPSLNVHLDDPANSIQVYPQGFQMHGSRIKMRLKANISPNVTDKFPHNLSTNISSILSFNYSEIHTEE